MNRCDISSCELQQAVDSAVLYAKSFPHSGHPACYIPELANADCSQMGLCLVTTTGERFTSGSWQQKFTIQSISKTLSLIFALSHISRDSVFGKVGIEPNGNAFNSLIELETKTPYPLNPMINAGAIVVADCCVAAGLAFDDFLKLVRRLCRQSDIQLNETVFRSEVQTGDRNRSIAYLLHSDGILSCPPEETLDFYFRMCSLDVTTQDLANYAALLSNGGRDILTGEQIVESWITRTVKTLMLTCGMYNGTGEFALRVGMPGKSGVGGGIIATAEGKFGIAAYSPALDKCGNSVAAQHMLEYLSDRLSLHFFHK